MRPLLSDNPLWEAFGLRALTQALSGGADFGEVVATIERVGDGGSGEDWHREWTATAERVEAIGDEAAARGRWTSAREAYHRATMYFDVAFFPLFGRPLDPRLLDAFERSERCFHKAAPLWESPVELLDVPFEGGALPAYLFLVDDSSTPRPTVVHTNGYDSNLQEMVFAHAPAALRRGYHVLLFDGPGQGRCLYRDGMTIRPDWENVVRPVIDYALTRREIDPERIVLAGWSFGGFLAPRAAGVEHRIAALVADPGQWDQRAAVALLPLSDEDKARFPDIDPSALEPLQAWLEGPEADPLLRWRLLDRGPMVHGVDSLFDYFSDICRFALSPVAADIACPTLLTAPEGDPIAAGAPRLFEALTVERKALVRFSAAEGAAGHCEALARTLYHQRVYDWLDETLAL